MSFKENLHAKIKLERLFDSLVLSCPISCEVEGTEKGGFDENNGGLVD
jgi:hypothetical protein